MKKPICRWCGGEMQWGRKYQNFCCLTCVNNWEDSNCQGHSDLEWSLWCQRHEGGREMYSMITEKFWEVFRKEARKLCQKRSQ